MRRVILQGPADVAGFRRQARALAAAEVPPDQVVWATAGQADDLFSSMEEAPVDTLPASSPRFTVPAGFVRLCDAALLHSDPQRFALMYRLLWRLKQSPSQWMDTLDPERRRADHMAREVRRAIHKMHAFVRFFPVQDDQGEQYLAWFEPPHFVEEAAAPFFARRFANMRWAILTPRCTLSWDGQALTTGPAGRREDVPPMDAGAELWLTYYRSIFNPARLKVSMMEKEMPRRYWANLPEAALIDPLIAQAHERTTGMLTADATEPRRIRPMRTVDRSGD